MQAGFAQRGTDVSLCSLIEEDPRSWSPEQNERVRDALASFKIEYNQVGKYGFRFRDMSSGKNRGRFISKSEVQKYVGIVESKEVLNRPQAHARLALVDLERSVGGAMVRYRKPVVEVYDPHVHDAVLIPEDGTPSRKPVDHIIDAEFEEDDEIVFDDYVTGDFGSAGFADFVPNFETDWYEAGERGEIDALDMSEFVPDFSDVEIDPVVDEGPIELTREIPRPEVQYIPLTKVTKKPSFLGGIYQKGKNTLFALSAFIGVSALGLTIMPQAPRYSPPIVQQEVVTTEYNAVHGKVAEPAVLVPEVKQEDLVSVAGMPEKKSPLGLQTNGDFIFDKGQGIYSAMEEMSTAGIGPIRTRTGRLDCVDRLYNDGKLQDILLPGVVGKGHEKKWVRNGVTWDRARQMINLGCINYRGKGFE